MNTNIVSDLSDRAASIRSQATDWICETGEQLAKTEKKLVKDAGKYAKDANNYVAANPWKVIGIAVLAALVVGRLMK